jgi:hypothetical protein
MDASISHDPYAPDGGIDEATVNRWLRVGATEDEIRAVAPGFHTASVDDSALAKRLEEYRATQADEAGTPVVTEAEALKGEWTPAADVEIDGTEYPTWDLEGGWLAILVGDEHNGVHLVGYGIEGVTSKLRAEIHTTGEVVAAEQGHANTEAWQAAKNLADAKARATA